VEIDSIVVEDFEKRYRYFRLRIPRAEFKRGVNLIIGPNGSGKSTLLKSVAGFVRPNRGSIYAKAGDRRILTASILHRIGYVGEDVVLPNIRVRDILEAFFSDEAPEAARELGLTDYLHKRYLELSAGYRRRVQLAIALGKGADILLLDEPFANLDVLMIEPLKQTLENLKDKVVLVTSHNVFNLRISTLTLIDQGELIYHGEYRGGGLEVLVDVGEREVAVDIDGLNKLLEPHKIKVKRVVTLQEKIVSLMSRNRSPEKKPTEQHR